VGSQATSGHTTCLAQSIAKIINESSVKMILFQFCYMQHMLFFVQAITLASKDPKIAEECYGSVPELKSIMVQ
jgi:hypothetical protein